MTSISYDDVFDKFIGNVTDIELTSLNESDAYALMGEYLHKSVSEPYVRRLFSSIALDDEVQTLTFEMKLETEESADTDFVTSALAKWMVYEWLRNQVRSKVNTMQMFAGKEQKFYSQSNHVAELRGLMDDTYKECRGFIMDRGWINNSYLEGGA